MSFNSLKRSVRKCLPSVVVDTIHHLKRFSPLQLHKDFSVKVRYAKLNKRYRISEKVRVAFLVQMPEIWDKQEPVYDAMLLDDRFEPEIIVVPPYDFENKCVSTDYGENYFLRKYPDAVCAFDGGGWINLSKRKYDYVFFQRPYDWYLPKPLQSYVVVSCARCCYIPYAYWPLAKDLCGYNRDFFRCVYFAFMESRENALYIQKLEKDTNRIIFCGYPSLDGIEAADGYDVGSVLWTPRWNYDEDVGGSHFFEYKDEIIRLREYWPNVDVTIRPHPLAFPNYIANGLLTAEGVEDYKRTAADKGVRFDANARVEDTFLETGVLITDVSSIVYPYFMTEKPIIFCNSSISLSPSFTRLLKGMYVANSWKDILFYYGELVRGNDPLKEERRRIARDMRAANNGSIEKILGVLADEIRYKSV